ncbi:MAG: hypothetical protein KDB53_09055, partial [Planctomycetes bacterium]|nr:hypothetical protein [Planctomycetota bacterium]
LARAVEAYTLLKSADVLDREDAVDLFDELLANMQLGPARAGDRAGLIDRALVAVIESLAAATSRPCPAEVASWKAAWETEAGERHRLAHLKDRR